MPSMEWGFDRRFAVGALAVSLFIAIAGIGITILWPDKKGIGWALLILAPAIFWVWTVFEILQWVDKPKSRVVISLLSACVIFGVLFFIYFRYGQAEHLQETKTLLLPVELSLSCSMTDLPVPVHQDSSLEIIFLNSRMTHNQKGHEYLGFFTLENDGSKDYTWPPETSRSKGAHLAMQAYRCTLQNTGPSNLGEIVMAAKIYYGSNHDDDFDVRYFEINPLPAGGRYPFYVINQCPVNASAIIGDSARLHVVGESEPRVVPVSLSGENPVGNILIFSPSNYKWHPCSVEDDKLMQNAKPPQK
jgi:hypothetical protein